MPIAGLAAAKTYDGSPLRIGIIHARWNEALISALLDGTLSALRGAGVKDANIVVQSVPGSYELPFAASRMYAASLVEAQQHSALGGLTLGGATDDLLGGSTTDLTATKPAETERKAAGGSTQAFDAVIAIGALIKGATMHFEYISDAVSHGLMRVQLEQNVPVVFGLLTLLTEEQGRERAGILEGAGGKMTGHNHGVDWGNAAVELGVKRRGWAEGSFVV